MLAVTIINQVWLKGSSIWLLKIYLLAIIIINQVAGTAHSYTIFSFQLLSLQIIVRHRKILFLPKVAKLMCSKVGNVSLSQEKDFTGGFHDIIGIKNIN